MTGGGEGDIRGVFVDPVVCMTVAEVSIEEVSEAFAVTLQHLHTIVCVACVFIVYYILVCFC